MDSLGAVLRGSFRYGLEGKVGHGMVWRGATWLCLAGMAYSGKAGLGLARRDLAGMAWDKNKEEPYMVYQWKIPGIIPTDAQTAGNELDRIYQKHGELNPSDIVDESRPDYAPLHPCFEWDDAKAAEKYREHQAGNIVRNITVVCDTQEEPQNVRAFVRVQSTYQPINIVLEDTDKTQELLQSALRELKAFRDKYKTLASLAPVMSAIEQVETEQLADVAE